MPKLFKRTAFLEVGGIRYNTRINFNITKTSDSKSNKAQCTVYNLSETSRSLLEAKDQPMIIKAGHGEVAEILFIGDMASVATKRAGADIVTTLQSGDGEKILADATLDIGLAKGATAEQVFSAIKSAFGLPVGVVQGFPNRTFTNGFTFSGRAADALDLLLKGTGVDWSIRENELQVLPRSLATNETVVILTPDTGMLGSPTKTAEGFNVRSLLNPRLTIGRRIRIESRQLSDGADFKVIKVGHKGDSYTGSYESIVEGIGLG